MKFPSVRARFHRNDLIDNPLRNVEEPAIFQSPTHLQRPRRPYIAPSCLLLALIASFLTPATTVAADARHFNFEQDITPLLSRFGCNAAGCHGKAEGQNGFKLSVFGYDPRADYDALVKEARGRRVFPAMPDRSLMLLKASGGIPHGGGVRFLPGSPEYQTIRDWI